MGKLILELLLNTILADNTLYSAERDPLWVYADQSEWESNKRIDFHGCRAEQASNPGRGFPNVSHVYRFTLY